MAGGARDICLVDASGAPDFSLQLGGLNTGGSGSRSIEFTGMGAGCARQCGDMSASSREERAATDGHIYFTQVGTKARDQLQLSLLVGYHSAPRNLQFVSFSMLISHRHNFIYTKTVKTGGTSTESFFERFCLPDGEFTQMHGRDEIETTEGVIGQRGEVPQGAKPKWRNHMAASQIKRLAGDTVWESYFKFCVIRDPYEKCISAYDHFVIRAGRPLEVSELEYDPLLTNEQNRFLTYVSQSAPRDRDKYFIDGAFCLDDVIRYENLEAEIQRICSVLALPFDLSYLPKFKAGLRQDTSTPALLYSQRALDLVERIFAYEISEFGYSRPEL